MMRTNQFITVTVFLKKENKALLLQRSKEKTFLPGYWEQAGGKVEKGEHPYDAARREVKEETSLDVKIKNPYYINFYKMEDGTDMIEIAFMGEIVGNKKVGISSDHQSFRWVSFEELSRLQPLSSGMKNVIEQGFKNYQL